MKSNGNGDAHVCQQILEEVSVTGIYNQFFLVSYLNFCKHQHSFCTDGWANLSVNSSKWLCWRIVWVLNEVILLIQKCLEPSIYQCSFPTSLSSSFPLLPLGNIAHKKKKKKSTSKFGNKQAYIPVVSFGLRSQTSRQLLIRNKWPPPIRTLDFQATR